MFTILLSTYNRHEMLKHCIQSVLNQTYQNYEVLIMDRGSEPSAEPIVKSFNDPRLKYIRSTQEIHSCDTGNYLIKNQMKGDFFVVLADDDAWTTTALERVADVFHNNPDCGIVQTAVIPYNQTTTKQNINDDFLSGWSRIKFFDRNYPLIFEFDGRKIAKFNFSSYGIGDRNDGSPMFVFHPSAIFIRKNEIEKVWEKQGGLFIKPFGDGGYNPIYYNTKLMAIKLPLTLMGLFHERETDAIMKNRHKWAKEKAGITHSPVKNTTFLNLGSDELLRIIYMNGIDKDYKTYIRSFFFYKQIDLILQDFPDPTIYKDLYEIMKYIGAKKFFRHISRNQLSLKNILKLNYLRGKITSSMVRAEDKKVIQKEFPTMLDYISWIDKEFLPRIIDFNSKENITNIKMEEKVYEKFETLLKKKEFQKIIDKLAKKYKDKKIIIYGIGKICDVMFDNYDFSGLNIIAVSDIKFQKGDFYRNIEAINPFDIPSKNPDIVLIAMSKYYLAKDFFENDLFQDYDRFKYEALLKISIFDVIKNLFSKIKH